MVKPQSLRVRRDRYKRSLQDRKRHPRHQSTNQLSFCFENRTLNQLTNSIASLFQNSHRTIDTVIELPTPKKIMPRATHYRSYVRSAQTLLAMGNGQHIRRSRLST
jgi:hypothetical protein